MNELHKAAEMALEALSEIEWSNNSQWQSDRAKVAITALREALAEQPAQQEPVANIRTWHKNGDQHAELWNWDRGIESLPDGEHDLYTRPQAPATPLHGEPLTDEDIDDIWNHYCDEMGDASINDSYEIARAIEAKLKEKNT